MSIFPFIQPIQVESKEETVELPVYKEYAFDFETNSLLKDKSGNNYLVSGSEAIKIWIYKALRTERFRYLTYDDNYGCEAENLIGKVNDFDVYTSEFQRYITEALIYNPYIQELKNFQFCRTESGATVTFECITIYEAIEISMEGGNRDV